MSACPRCRRKRICARRAAADANTRTPRIRSLRQSSFKAISMNLPDAELLCQELVSRLRSGVTDSTGLVGIRTGGAWLAQRLHRELKLATPPGALDISFYRDDFETAGLHHQRKPSHNPLPL